MESPHDVDFCRNIDFCCRRSQQHTFNRLHVWIPDSNHLIDLCSENKNIKTLEEITLGLIFFAKREEESMGIILLTKKFKPCAQSNNGSVLIFTFSKLTHLCTKNHYCLFKTSHYNSFLGLNLFLNLLRLHLQPPFLDLRK